MATKTIEERLIPTTQYVTPTTGAVDGDVIKIGTSQILTAITHGNGTIILALTTMALGGFASYIYSGTASKWLRIG